MNALATLCAICSTELRTIGSTGVTYCPHCDTTCQAKPCAVCQAIGFATNQAEAEAKTLDVALEGDDS